MHKINVRRVLDRHDVRIACWWFLFGASPYYAHEPTLLPTGRIQWDWDRSVRFQSRYRCHDSDTYIHCCSNKMCRTSSCKRMVTSPKVSRAGIGPVTDGWLRCMCMSTMLTTAVHRSNTNWVIERRNRDTTITQILLTNCTHQTHILEIQTQMTRLPMKLKWSSNSIILYQLTQT